MVYNLLPKKLKHNLISILKLLKLIQYSLKHNLSLTESQIKIFSFMLIYLSNDKLNQNFFNLVYKKKFKLLTYFNIKIK